MTWTIGSVTVTPVIEIEATGGTRFILPQATPERIRPIRWLCPHFANEEGKLRMTIQAMLVRTPTRRILVDTCIGNDKPRDVPSWNGLQTRFLEKLAELGSPRESIDTVLCTHLHVDHVGWNTMWRDGAWVPTFPNARYLFERSELNYWDTQKEHAADRVIFEDSVRPVLQAGLADAVDPGHRVSEEIDLVSTAGHTPGHVSIRIRSGGQEALITGDFVHHPCQMAHLDWSATVDYDAPAAIETRRRVFSQLAGTDTLMIGTHFAAPTAGRVVRDGDGFRLEV